MHPNILSENQHQLIPFVAQFIDDYYLAGGTAIALQVGHRRSIDFDLFTQSEIDFERIQRTILKFDLPFVTRYQDSNQLMGSSNLVQITFHQYPFSIETPVTYENQIRMPDLFTLASMKAYALGRRAKWKDYVDMFILLKDHFSLADISSKAESIFGSLFNAKLLRQQLSYFEDVDYREKVEYIDVEYDDTEIKEFLVDVATQKL